MDDGDQAEPTETHGTSEIRRWAQNETRGRLLIVALGLGIVGAMILAHSQQVPSVKATVVASALLLLSVVAGVAALLGQGLIVGNPARLLLMITAGMAGSAGVWLLIEGAASTTGKWLVFSGCLALAFCLAGFFDRLCDELSDNEYQLSLFALGCALFWIGIFEVFNLEPFLFEAAGRADAIMITFLAGTVAIFLAGGGYGLKSIWDR